MARTVNFGVWVWGMLVTGVLIFASPSRAQAPIAEPPPVAPTVENLPPATDTPVAPRPPIVEVPPGQEAPPLFPPPPVQVIPPGGKAPVVAPTPQSTASPENIPAPPSTAAPGEETPTSPEDENGIVTSDAETPGGRYSIEAPGGVVYDQARGIAAARGQVTFRYRDFEVTGDRGIVDYNTNKATLAGNLKVRVRGRTFDGETLVFDLTEGTWVLSQLTTIFPPSVFPPGTVLSPIYAQALSVTGDAENVRGTNLKVSSCDRDDYYFISKRLEFFRDANGEPDRVVLKKNFLYILGKKILPIPVFVIALNGSRSRRVGLLPTFGQNDFDGFFAKTVYDLSANQRRTDTLLFDVLQKRGLGLGLQRELSKGAGLAYLYVLSGKGPFGRQIDARLRRRWQITSSLLSNLNFQSTSNSTQGSDLSSRNGDLTFAYARPNISSNLFLRTAQSSTSGGTFQSNGITFQHRQKLGAWDLSADSLYNGSSFGTTSNSATLDNTLSVGRKDNIFDSLLRLELHDDLTGKNRNGAYQLERLPELTLVSDTERLKVPFLSRLLPGRFDLSLGEFNEPSTTQESRALLGYTVNQRDIKLLNSGSFESKFQIAGRFGQAFYGDSSARYNYDYLVNWNNKLGALSTQVDYRKQKSVGFTPFQFDFLGPSESVDATLAFTPSDKFRFNLSSGRDLQNGFTRDLVGTLQFAPSRSLYGSVGFSYSPESGELGDITTNLRLSRSPNKFLGGTLDLGVRYTPKTSQIARVNIAADVFVTRKTRVQALSSYNGFSQSFDFNQIRLTQDLHCFNLYATFDSQTKQFRLDLALKAFPFVDTRFGQGQLGTGFDPYVGQSR